jgi:hypothetical protein
MVRWRLYSSRRSSVRERSFCPMNLSTAAFSRRGSLVNSCYASIRPLVWITAAMSFAPR